MKKILHTKWQFFWKCKKLFSAHGRWVVWKCMEEVTSFWIGNLGSAKCGFDCSEPYTWLFETWIGTRIGSWRVLGPNSDPTSSGGPGSFQWISKDIVNQWIVKFLWIGGDRRDRALNTSRAKMILYENVHTESGRENINFAYLCLFMWGGHQAQSDEAGSCSWHGLDGSDDFFRNFSRSTW
jgi:hypothetical protein